MVVELPHGEHSFTAADEVASYELLWERLWAASARGDDARRVFERVAREYREG